MKKTETGLPLLSLEEFNVFVEKWNKSRRPKAILLLGATGVGKTTALKNEFKYKYPDGTESNGYYTAYELVESYSKFGLEFEKELNKDIRKGGIACIDDVGNEPIGNHFGIKFNVLEFFLQKRYSCNGNVTMISNLNLEDLTAKYGERVVSRIHEMCYVIVLEGKDFRTQADNFQLVNELLK